MCRAKFTKKCQHLAKDHFVTCKGIKAETLEKQTERNELVSGTKVPTDLKYNQAYISYSKNESVVADAPCCNHYFIDPLQC